MRALTLFCIFFASACTCSAATKNTHKDAETRPKLAETAAWSHELNALNHHLFEYYSVRQYDDASSSGFDNIVQAINKTHIKNTLSAPKSADDTLIHVYRSWDAIVQHAHEKKIESIVEYLSHYHQLLLLDKLLNVAQSKGNTRLLDIIHYEKSQLAAHAQQWDKAYTYLKAITKNTSLSAVKKQHATLMFGIALQKQRKHREAISIYNNIPEKSPYFHEAQLNLATAYIRQDWWTDAHIAIKKSEAATSAPETILHDRMLMVLGYSQFNKEFYRDARDTFRKIAIESIYADRALLGIGLSALAQEDHKGAVNAFEYLTEQNSRSLSTDEAYLMLPYTYNKDGKNEKAAENYVGAIAHFNTVLEDMRKKLVRYDVGATCPSPEYAEDTELLRIYTMLGKLNNTPKFNRHHANIISARHALRAHVIQQCSDSVAQYSKHINSYINQSNYGLAKLYDQ